MAAKGVEHNCSIEPKNPELKPVKATLDQLLLDLGNCQTDPEALIEQLEKALNQLEEECQCETVRCIEDGKNLLEGVLDGIGMPEGEKQNLMEQYDILFNPQDYELDIQEIRDARVHHLEEQLKKQAITRVTTMSEAEKTKIERLFKPQLTQLAQLQSAQESINNKLIALAIAYNDKIKQNFPPNQPDKQRIKDLGEQYAKIARKIEAIQTNLASYYYDLNQEKEALESRIRAIDQGNYYLPSGENLHEKAERLANQTVSTEENEVRHEYAELMKTEMRGFVRQLLWERLKTHCGRVDVALETAQRNLKNATQRLEPLREKVETLVDSGATAREITRARENYEKTMNSNPEIQHYTGEINILTQQAKELRQMMTQLG